MKSPLRYRCGRPAAVISAAVLAMGLGVPAASAASTPSGTGTFDYQVNPISRLAFPATAANPGGFPYTPSQCVALFGLECYSAHDLRVGYGVGAKINGTGQTIVIVDAFGSPTIRQDLSIYDQEFGLPDPTLNIYYPEGTPTFDPSSSNEESWAAETSLDVEQAHGIAPLDTIDLVIAPTNHGNTLDNAVKFAVDNHLGDVLSMSYGAPEDLINGNNDQVNQANAIFAQAVSQGMSLFASAGDSGATAGTGSITASYPASDPNVTSVGGTALFLSDTGAYESEDVWNDANDCPFGCTAGEFGATGGAPSALFPEPAYQTNNIGPNPNPTRDTSDVAFNASVYTATMIYLGYPGTTPGFYFFGGTSEGAPSWAALTALAVSFIGHPLGNLNDLLYPIYGTGYIDGTYFNDFHVVTQGNNAFNGPGFSADGGYSLPTGLGSPNFDNLLNTLSGGR